MKFRDFRDSENPPILHRKETFVPAEHPSRAKFERLTKQEERAGLFDDPSRIGTRSGWENALAVVGRRVAGHRLQRVMSGHGTDRPGEVDPAEALGSSAPRSNDQPGEGPKERKRATPDQ